MSIVYVIHEPTRYDHRNRQVIAMDLSKAKEWGELKVIFPGVGIVPPKGRKFVQQITDVLRGYKVSDFLLIAGDFELIVWASIIIERLHSYPPTLLKWNGRDQAYISIAAPELAELVTA